MGFCSFTGQFVASLMLCVQWELHPEQQIYQQLGPYTQNYEIGRRTSSVVPCQPSVFPCKPSVFLCKTIVFLYHPKPKVFLCQPNVFLCQPRVFLCKLSVFLCQLSIFLCQPHVFLCQPKSKVCGVFSSLQTPPAGLKTLVKMNGKCWKWMLNAGKMREECAANLSWVRKMILSLTLAFYNWNWNQPCIPAHCTGLHTQNPFILLPKCSFPHPPWSFLSPKSPRSKRTISILSSLPGKDWFKHCQY